MKNEWLIRFGGFSELRVFGRVTLFKHWSTFSNPFFTHTHTRFIWRSLGVPPNFSSVHSVVFNSLWLHELQHNRLPCPSPTPEACSNSCPLSQWCHPTISSSVVPFFSCLQSFPASGSFPMSLFFPSGGQRIGASALASVLPVNSQDWFPLELTGLTYWAITNIGNW